MYVYIQSEFTGQNGATMPLWTVGFYDPKNKWQAESDHASKEEAAERAAYMNGRVARVLQSVKARNAGKNISDEQAQAEADAARDALVYQILDDSGLIGDDDDLRIDMAVERLGKVLEVVFEAGYENGVLNEKLAQQNM